MKTENIGLMFASRSEAVEYNVVQPVGYFLVNYADVGGLSLDIPDCNDEGCVWLLVIGLIFLVFILVIGSAYIPHFWLLSGALLLCIMALITLHDLRIRRSVSASRSPAGAGRASALGTDTVWSEGKGTIWGEGESIIRREDEPRDDY